ncbi:MAG: oxidoreductase C-terminal domain-containing protein, partial [Actinomycetes bacterium]
VATAACRAGCRVTVVEAGEAPLGAALSADVGRLTLPWYADAGADLRLGATVADVVPGRLHLASGEEVGFDVAVVGVGVRPATAWLDGSPVPRDGRGAVLVDAGLRTDLPGVYAAGDCLTYPSTRYGRRMRVEHWDHALRTPDIAVASLLGDLRGSTPRDGAGDGADTYDPVPYVWSEQFGRMVQYAGAPLDGTREVWRGDPAAGPWALCWLDEHDRLTAVLTVDRHRDLVQARRLAASGRPVDPARLADTDVPVKAAVRG